MDYLVGSLEGFKFWTDPKLYDSFTNNIDMNSFWKMCVKKYPNNIAIENEEYKLTYAELDIKASELRSAIIEEGCKEKDKIAIIGDNTIECVYSFLASMTAGCASVIIPPYFDCNKIEKFVKSFGISAIVYEKKFEETINELKEIIPNCAFIRTDKKGLAEYSSVNSNLEDDCLIMFTGGTTGNPKGAILSHKAVFRGTLNGCIGFKSCENQRFLLVLPLFHVFGLIRCVLTCFYMGGDVYIVSSEKSIIQDIKNFRPTFIAFVPTLAELVLNLSKKIGNIIYPELKIIAIGAASVPQYLIEEYTKMGIDIFPGYGMTETACIALGNPNPMEKVNSVGMPYPNEEIKIVNGELWIKGDNLLTDYIGTDEQAWNDEGWFQTGDLAKIDEDGYVYILGRSKNVIVLKNGENIYPEELESKFNKLESVRDSEVYVDNDGKEEFLALDVVLRDVEESKESILDKLWKINNNQRFVERVRKINIRENDFERTANKKIVRRRKCQE